LHGYGEEEGSEAFAHGATEKIRQSESTTCRAFLIILTYPPLLPVFGSGGGGGNSLEGWFTGGLFVTVVWLGCVGK